MKYKVVNSMFMDAEYSFSMLKFYYDEVNNLLHRRAKDFIKFTDEMVEEHKKLHRTFDKEFWLKHYDVFSHYYPHLFHNAFIIQVCALFEFNIRKICTLVKEEHKVPVDWDDLKGSVMKRAKSFLWYARVILRDDPPSVILSPPNFIPIEVYEKNRFIAGKLWHELDFYFQVRNCIVHHNGLIDKLRSPEKLTRYALERKILSDGKSGPELSLNPDFNRDVCNTMGSFFSRLMGTYYSTPLQE